MTDRPIMTGTRTAKALLCMTLWCFII